MTRSPFRRREWRPPLRARTGSERRPCVLQELKEDPGSFQLDTLLARIREAGAGEGDGLPSLSRVRREKVVAGWRARAMKM